MTNLRWCSESVLDFLVLFYQLNSRFPKQKTTPGQGWTPEDVQFMTENGIPWPSTSTIRNYFTSFHNAVYCALIELEHSEESAMEYVRQNYTKADLTDLRATEKKYTSVSDEELLSRLYQAKLMIGSYPVYRAGGWKKSHVGIVKMLDIPSQITYSRRFGSYRKAKDMAEEQATLNYLYDGDNECAQDSPSLAQLEPENLTQPKASSLNSQPEDLVAK